MKYKVQLQAVVTATVHVECSDETEAKSIAENAWRPTINGAGIDPTIHAIYGYEVLRFTPTTWAFEVEQVQ